MTAAQLTDLINRYLADDCTEQEKQWIEQWYDDFDARPIRFYDGNELAINELARESYEELKQKIATNHKKEREAIVPASGNNRFRWLIPAAAAVAILLICTAAYLLWHKHPEQRLPVAGTENPYKNDVAPGGNKAMLILANGTSIVLDSSHNGTLARQGNTHILKFNGQIAYTSTAGKQATEVLYNTIVTPRGGQYQVVLPDGSKVWLNDASSLRFPTTFVGTERSVELTGEAYFEVTKNERMPFNVQVNGMAVKVLGTHFDVMAYDDEPAIRTSLLEGSVQVSRGSKKVVLVPGQQAAVGRSGEADIRVGTTDMDEVIAWKEGLFVFRNTDIQSVMRQIARWYDTEIAYAGNINTSMSGMISKHTNLSEVLNMLVLTGGAHFKIEGKRITVLP